MKWEESEGGKTKEGEQKWSEDQRLQQEQRWKKHPASVNTSIHQQIAKHHPDRRLPSLMALTVRTQKLMKRFAIVFFALEDRFNDAR